MAFKRYSAPIYGYICNAMRIVHTQRQTWNCQEISSFNHFNASEANGGIWFLFSLFVCRLNVNIKMKIICLQMRYHYVKRHHTNCQCPTIKYDIHFWRKKWKLEKYANWYYSLNSGKINLSLRRWKKMQTKSDHKNLNSIWKILLFLPHDIFNFDEKNRSNQQQVFVFELFSMPFVRPLKYSSSGGKINYAKWRA